MDFFVSLNLLPRKHLRKRKQNGIVDHSHTYFTDDFYEKAHMYKYAYTEEMEVQKCNQEYSCMLEYQEVEHQNEHPSSFLFRKRLRKRKDDGHVDHTHSFYIGNDNIGNHLETFEFSLAEEVEYIKMMANLESDSDLLECQRSEADDGNQTSKMKDQIENIDEKETFDEVQEMKSSEEYGEEERVEIAAKFPVGNVVWGKFGKNMWWPAIVIHGKQAKQQTKPNQQWLYWLSDRKLSQIKSDNIVPFHKQLLRHLMKKPIKDAMDIGIQRALWIFLERLTTNDGMNLNEGIQMNDEQMKAEIVDGQMSDEQIKAKIADMMLEPLKLLELVQSNSELLNPEKETPIPSFVIDDLKKYNGQETEKEDPGQNCLINLCSYNRHKNCLKNYADFDPNNTCLACLIPCPAVNKHPLFEGVLCERCKIAMRKHLFAIDVDECSLVCAICADLGHLVVCGNTQCGKCYCIECINNFTHKDTLDMIKKDPDWTCFLCEEYTEKTHGKIVPRIDREEAVIHFYNDVTLCDDLSYLTCPGKRKIRVLSLFDGIGTGKFVLDELGFDIEVYYYSEIFQDSLNVVRYNHKDTVKPVGDAWKLNKKQLQNLCPVDLVLAGPPCNDLSIVNPRRKGFEGSGVLVFKFLMILRDIEALCKGSTHVFWMMENTGCMLNDYKEGIVDCFGFLLEEHRKDWDYGSGSHIIWPLSLTIGRGDNGKPKRDESMEAWKGRIVWGSTGEEILVPGINGSCSRCVLSPGNIHLSADRTSSLGCQILLGSETLKKLLGTPDVLYQLEKEKTTLDDVLTPGYNRRAVVQHTRTITSQKNSLSITNGKNDKLVTMDDIEDEIWVEEIERLFGFPTGYTDTGDLPDTNRRRLLGKAWSIPVVKQILSPLRKYFKLRDTGS